MKRILGLDIGTNSVGWALMEMDNNSEDIDNGGRIIGAGSRIIPMSQNSLSDFDKGVSISQTAERTSFRGVRRLRERHLLRRERLHRILNILGFLPLHYLKEIDFENRLGQFLPETEPKLNYYYDYQTRKSEFLFKDSFNEMVEDFRKSQPQLLVKPNGDPALIPYDWTIYYLRKKALSQKISKEELSWILLNFNQKRGYYQLRGEEEELENTNKVSDFFKLKVIEVTEGELAKDKSEKWYNVYLENGWIYRRTSKESLKNWIGKEKEFIVTVELNDDKTIKKGKDGSEKRSFKSVDSEKDWIAIKKSTEEKIEKSKKTVGVYIYESLLNNPNQKIRGKLVRVIERKFYKSELQLILNKQIEFHKELQNKDLYEECINELYENNDSHRNNITNRGFSYLFIDDIIFYQRPLKSKKSLISNCKFENRIYINDGVKSIQTIKCIAKSHPLYQEFRLWQFINNLRIYQRQKTVNGKLELDVNVTGEFLKNDEDIVQLFDWLNKKNDIDQKAFLKFPGFGLKKEIDNFRWNYVEDKSYPCNETKSKITSRLSKIEGVSEDFINEKNKEEALWHILYSIEDKIEIKKALNTFAVKNGLNEEFAEVFSKFPKFDKEYGSYSEKAIKKLLPLMRTGKYWSKENIHTQTLERINKIKNWEDDESIRDRVRDKSILLEKIEDYKFLPVWLASYIVYDRHSEDGESKKWKTSAEIELLKQHSLRNPIVEQVINESIQVVRDIWNKYGEGKENYFDEIHIELGREMKIPKEEREKMTKRINENENTNLRMKAMLMELINDKSIENVRPYSPMQQEILKIYEEGAINSQVNLIPDDILKISKLAQPTASELSKYILWIQQKYLSPYTGNVIPLGKLFTSDFEIEHIIPQSRYFDDSFSNKIICEEVINKDKGNCTAYEYIKENSGKKIELSNGKETTIFTLDQYESFVNKNYGNLRSKKRKLLMEDIPDEFIQRQINDTRYISKVVMNIMSNIVRDKDEQETNSKNVIATNGMITSTLKQDWDLNNVWNELITPRFERLNKLTNSNNFGDWTDKNGKKVFQINIPLEYQKGFNKKRIDHRHHALDAIVVACTSKNHVNYFNNVNSLGKDKKEVKEKTRYDLKNKLCYKKYNDSNKKSYNWVFKAPWNDFDINVKNIMSGIVVSFKQNLRIINKTSNKFQKLKKDSDGNLVKEIVRQTKGDNWAIRKPMHKETVSGLVSLRFTKTVKLSQAINDFEKITDISLRNKIKEFKKKEIDNKKILKYFGDSDNKFEGQDISKVEVFYYDNDNVASRVKIDGSFNSSKIDSITDTGIQKIMKNHLLKYNSAENNKITEHPELAFSNEGIEEMNKNIKELNERKVHKPIYKVRTYELKGNKFTVGQTGNKKDKYVEAAKDTNLFFAIYENDKGKRFYESIPLNTVIERQIQGDYSVPETDEKGNKLLFHLSPNDLVYMPTQIEIESNKIDMKSQKEISGRIYKMVSCTSGECHFIPNYVATKIVNNVELGTNNKSEKAWDGNINYKENQKGKIQRTDSGRLIKENCIKIRLNRIGQII